MPSHLVQLARGALQLGQDPSKQHVQIHVELATTVLLVLGVRDSV